MDFGRFIQVDWNVYFIFFFENRMPVPVGVVLQGYTFILNWEIHLSFPAKQNVSNETKLLQREHGRTCPAEVKFSRTQPNLCFHSLNPIILNMSNFPKLRNNR